MTDDGESPVLRDVLVGLSQLPRAHVWRHNTGRLPAAYGRWVSFGLVGSGDIIGCIDGRAVSVECKRPKGGVTSEQQRRFAAAWRKAGGIYVRARSLEEALEGLRDGIA